MEATTADRLRVSVVLPVRDQATSVALVLRQLSGDLVHQIVIVDRESSDGTLEAARSVRPDATIRRLPRTAGRRLALAEGFAAATGDVVVTLPVDGSADPTEIERYVAALAAGADFVKGSRVVVGGGSTALSPLTIVWLRLLSWFANRITGAGFTDVAHASFALWTHYARELDLAGLGGRRPHDTVVDVLFACRVAAAGAAVVEVPSTERVRLFGSRPQRLPAFRLLHALWRERRAADAGQSFPAPTPVRAVPSRAKASTRSVA
ncbi:MAG TPA: glycosyltransferase family 2 protein [Nocardioides sp.]|uniref:glycosyltransferase family 2 protein n=1 Tax=Nocardioides sp. TaxID=35761 RepID=UPI002EDA5C69